MEWFLFWYHLLVHACIEYIVDMMMLMPIIKGVQIRCGF